jgi:hypothetical protein
VATSNFFGAAFVADNLDPDARAKHPNCNSDHHPAQRLSNIQRHHSDPLLSPPIPKLDRRQIRIQPPN